MLARRKAEARRWFLQALYDLKAARWNIQGGFHDTACFLAQQAGEKTLKSLLYYLGSTRTALLTHSLVEMIEGAKKQVNALARLSALSSPKLRFPLRAGWPSGPEAVSPILRFAEFHSAFGYPLGVSHSAFRSYLRPLVPSYAFGA